MNEPSLRQPDPVPHRRLCLAADVERYSLLDTRAQSAVQADLVRLLDRAARLTGLDRAGWARQPQGDQEFAVLPESTPEAVVPGAFVTELAAGLGALNSRPGAPRVRLRLALDAGVVADAALGHAGPAPVAVARFVNAPPLRAALAGLTSADLAVIVSDRLFQDVVRFGHPGLDPADYVRVDVRVKEFGGYGWIRVPGHGPDDVRPWVEGTRGEGTRGVRHEPSGSAAPSSRPAPSGSSSPSSPDGSGPGRPALSQYVQQGAAVGRDVNGGLRIGLPVVPPPAGPRRAG
ncbi:MULTISPECIES: hypothetical protein [unclassified Streptomyces]|uniref:hypothetical protein n=1 Tax=unclassified Streptomyces TaxID=2593676 RepID=UPI0006FB56D2|nr:MULTISPECIES: hypothetical protein [unclassified Streptomyces]KQX50818.1 hypothetical protein ASD33_12340 [Streptomyces sp. Root1304]KRA84983.1 hypothetical protein ASE09_12345 [Streptomyces sp. Root66D1]